MPEKMFQSLVEFLGKWFRALSDHTFKVNVDNIVDNGDKLEEIKEVITSLTFPEPKDFPKKIDVNVKNWPKEKEREGPEKVEVINWPKFPKLDFKLPEIFKIEGKVTTDIVIPEPKEVVIEFPKVQEITGIVSINQFKNFIDGLQVVVDTIRELTLELENKSFGGDGTVTAMPMGSHKPKISGTTLWDPDDEAPTFVGSHTNVNADTGIDDWEIIQYTRDEAGNVTKILRKKGIWNNRSSLF